MNKASIKPESDNLCILFNENGQIVYIHRVIVFPGSHTAKTQDMEVVAKARASKAGLDISKLSALQVPGHKYDASSLYHVDITTKALVKTKEGERKSVS